MLYKVLKGYVQCGNSVIVKGDTFEADESEVIELRSKEVIEEIASSSPSAEEGGSRGTQAPTSDKTGQSSGENKTPAKKKTNPRKKIR